jgi:hypothetical protein
VREVLDTGAKSTDVAIRYPVDRRTVHRWLVRYATAPSARFAIKLQAGSLSQQIAPEIEALIVSLRKVWCEK